MRGDNGDFAKAALRRLKEGALCGQSGKGPDSQPSEEIVLFNPYEEVDFITDFILGFRVVLVTEPQ
jgi:hypothetical protein